VKPHLVSPLYWILELCQARFDPQWEDMLRFLVGHVPLRKRRLRNLTFAPKQVRFATVARQQKTSPPPARFTIGSYNVVTKAPELANLTLRPLCRGQRHLLSRDHILNHPQHPMDL